MYKDLKHENSDFFYLTKESKAIIFAMSFKDKYYNSDNSVAVGVK